LNNKNKFDQTRFKNIKSVYRSTALLFIYIEQSVLQPRYIKILFHSSILLFYMN